MFCPGVRFHLASFRFIGLNLTVDIFSLFTNTMCGGAPINETEALAGLRPWNFIVNILTGTADLPGTGDERLSFISMQDCGRFVAASLDLPTWKPDTGHMVGETTTYNKVVEACERMTGRTFLRKYTSREELIEGMKVPAMTFYNQVGVRSLGFDRKCVILKSMVLDFVQCRLKIVDGDADIEPNLNALCPEVKPDTVEGYLSRYWTGPGVKLPVPAWGEDRIAV